MRSQMLAIILVSIVCIAGLVGWWMWLASHRYEIVGGGQGVAYKIDRSSGRTWVLLPNGAVREVSPP